MFTSSDPRLSSHPLRREAAGEHAALAGLALDAEIGGMPLQHVLHDGEPETRAAAVAASGAVHPVETLREPRDVLGGDADPGVADAELGAVRIGRPADADPAGVGGVAHGVEHQVGEGAVELALGAEYPQGVADLHLHVPRAIAQGL